MPNRRLLFALAALAALALSPGASLAQEAPPESDPAAVLYRTAQILEAEGELELADALMDYILRRYPESGAAAAIRLGRAASDRRRVEGNGRTELVVWSTLYGLWLGVAVPGMLGADGPEPYGVGLLIGGPVGFGVARKATENVSVTDGQAGIVTWAGSWGTWQGLGWVNVVDFGKECPAGVDPFHCTDEPSEEATLAWMVAGGLAGVAGGVMAARRLDITPGDAALVNLGSAWGTWYGVVAAVLADVENGDAVLATTLIGGNLGAVAGAALARSYPISSSQARLASIIGVVGGLAGAGLDLIIQPENARVMIAIPAVASAIGLGIGASRIDLARSGSEPSEPGGAEWSFGGPLFTSPVRGPNGNYHRALSVTLLTGSF